MQIELNPLVDKFLIDGCMRCKYGATPKCKVLKWTTILEQLRQIVLETGLTEEIKWGVPTYTLQGKNVVNITALKDSAVLGFFKGALLTDSENILEKQGEIHSSRILRFRNVGEVERLQNILIAYIIEAIELESQGKKVEKPVVKQSVPEELLNIFETDKIFENAFYSLTPGRQRGYLIHFSQPKQSATRISRIEKCKPQILNGIGFHDLYKQNKG